ncbi:MAG: Gfo/Idh/MocA family oxidoreductase [Sedimentisphaerales bacterium]|nr:Gfo/Idh/MocA family oxidoreductase [Sedimentisphaerales bacterium]
MKRREFMKSAAAAATGILGFPTIVPSVVLGKDAPSGKINIAQIGFGRIARDHDLPDTIKHDMCRIVAVAELDSKRLADGKKWIEGYYAKKYQKENYINVKTYGDYHEIIADKSIDAVIISTPDHWHAQPAMEAALAGKDIYMQKPTSLTIAEGRQMADTIKRCGVIFQIGSQQRSRNPWPHFKNVCQMVRNGRIGRIKHVKVGLMTDPGCGVEPEMPIPANLNYDMWLGCTPMVYYTEKRVHPQKDFSRPGWLRCEQFGAGMITGWGSHHLDTAHWGMDTEYTGPVELEGTAVFPTSGLWDVHGDFDVHTKYASGVTMHISSKFPCGVRFEGDEGWIFVARGSGRATASDPVSGDPNQAPVLVSDKKLLEGDPGKDKVQLVLSTDQHLNWLESIQSRRQPITNAEIAHRSCSACLLSHIAMKLKRKLRWDPAKEQFLDDAEANAMLSRPQRAPYGTNSVKA